MLLLQGLDLHPEQILSGACRSSRPAVLLDLLILLIMLMHEPRAKLEAVQERLGHKRENSLADSTLDLIHVKCLMLIFFGSLLEESDSVD